MKKPQMFRMAIGLLRGLLGIFSLHILSPFVVLAQSTNPTTTPATNSSRQHQIAARVDSLSRSVEKLTVRVNSEMAANSDRVESFKETTNQLFWLFVFISAVSGALGVFVTVRAAKREEQLRTDYQSERQFNEKQQLEIQSRVLRIYENQALIGEKCGAHSEKIFNQ